MADTDRDPLIAPPVQDKRTQPPGVLPKNTQALVLGGLAFVMVAVIAFSGRNPPKERPTLSPASAVVDPNAARIQDYQSRIDEQVRKLQLEQAQLVHTQQVLGVSPGGLANAPGTVPGPSPAYPSYSRASASPYAGEESPEESAIQADKRKREYQSLFATNVALSYRKEASPTPPPSAPLDVDGLTKLLAGYRTPSSPATPISDELALGQTAPTRATARATNVGETPAAPADSSEERTAKSRARERDAEIDRAQGKQYRLFEGTVIETVLTNRLDGYFSGPMNCMVTTNVYSHDGQELLIPQGSRVLGEVRRVETFGQQRLAVFFHRVIMPDGYSLSLDKFQGLNQIGETGLVDQVNHHYLQVFGVSIAIGAIAGLGQVNTRSGLDISAADAYQEGVATSLSQSSLRILDRYLNVLPTITIREGHRVKVYLSDDLLLPAYNRHQMPGDL